MASMWTGSVAVMALLTGLVVLALGWRLGRRAAEAGARARSLTAAGSLLGAALLLSASEFVTPTFVGRVPYATHFEFHLPAGLLALGLVTTASTVNRRHLRRPVLFAAALFSIWCAMSFMGPLLVRLPQWGFSEDPASPPECQRTWWSCGATAAANLLYERGALVSERDAAILCDTRPWAGTTLAGLSSGLRRAGVPNRVEHLAAWEDLVRAPKPCLAITRVFGRVLHVVTVTEADERHVRLMDPMTGERGLARDEFLSEWTRCLVVPAEPATPAEHTGPGEPSKV